MLLHNFNYHTRCCSTNLYLQPKKRIGLSNHEYESVADNKKEYGK